MLIKPLLDAGTAARNMAEKEARYAPQEALIESNRCLFCFDAPCIMACPTGIDIPSFIKKIANGNPTGSARTILTANVLGASCARVCPTEVLCEGACVVLDLEGDPVKIGRLQRYATDYVFEHRIDVLQAPMKKNGKKVAILGAGPAGLGCAAELAQLGFDTTVFDKKKEGGGLNTYGIAYYKMPPQISLDEVKMIERLGVKFQYGVEIGKDLTMPELEKNYDAIFLALGLGGANRLGIPGENLPEVVDALEFIEWIHTKPLHEVPVGRRVAVLGCGNTAIDAVSQSKRLGADVATIIYRRGEDDMPAYGFEYELAKNDGATFHFHTIPTEVLAENGHVKALRLAKTETRDGKVQVIPGSEWTEEFDLVLKAVGQEKQSSTFEKLFPSLKLDRKGRVEHNPETMATSVPKLFVGGDCANGGREVVNAVAEGKKAARGINALLTKQNVTGPVQPSRYGAKDGALGSGFNHPIRVPELLAAMNS